MTQPETKVTLRAQQRQLIAGHRRAQMFPCGTPELPVPAGMGRVEAESGVFHYNPDKIDPATIQLAARSGRENEILDLGPYSKAEIYRRMLHGEVLCAIVERDAQGTEVRAAAGTHMTAPDQFAAMDRTKSPDHTVRIEDIYLVVNARRSAPR